MDLPHGTESPAVSDTSAATWKLVLAYDGTDYRGWQVQPGLLTIQGELSDAIERVTGERVLPQGSGRTDAGVHALAQVASFRMRAPVPAPNFKRALNRTLPSAIRVVSADEVGEDFHARHSATGKTYEYRVLVCDPFTGETCPPWLARFVYAVEQPVDLNRMQQAATAVIGEHDFTSFTAFDPDRTQRAADDHDEVSNTRTINSSTWSVRREDSLNLLVYRVHGNGFLHHMVRNLVGTFLEVGWGSRAPEEVVRILAEKDRKAAGRTAPARGLFLHDVQYDHTAVRSCRM